MDNIARFYTFMLMTGWGRVGQKKDIDMCVQLADSWKLLLEARSRWHTGKKILGFMTLALALISLNKTPKAQAKKRKK